jgi:hypothetical protein
MDGLAPNIGHRMLTGWSVRCILSCLNFYQARYTDDTRLCSARCYEDGTPTTPLCHHCSMLTQPRTCLLQSGLSKYSTGLPSWRSKATDTAAFLYRPNARRRSCGTTWTVGLFRIRIQNAQLMGKRLNNGRSGCY